MGIAEGLFGLRAATHDREQISSRNPRDSHPYPQNFREPRPARYRSIKQSPLENPGWGRPPGKERRFRPAPRVRGAKRDMAGASTASQSIKLAEAACKAMAIHGIMPTPHNYTVWYAYAAGT